MLPAVGREQTEKRVGHDREDRDHDAHDHPGLEVEPEQHAEQGYEGENRDGLQRDQVGPRHALDPARAAHDDGQADAEEDRDEQPGQRDASREDRRVEQLLADEVVPDRHVQDAMHRREQERRLVEEVLQAPVGHEVPEADEGDESADRTGEVGHVAAWLGRGDGVVVVRAARTEDGRRECPRCTRWGRCCGCGSAGGCRGGHSCAPRRAWET